MTVRQPRKFGNKLMRDDVKTDSNPKAAGAKIDLRRRVRDALGGPAQVHVLDCFAGEGVLARACWLDCATYVGCDEKWYRDRRLCYVVDNRRLLRCIDLARFNLFDLDSYGSPWEQAIIITARRQLKPGERIGIVLTEGTGFKMRLGGNASALLEMAGVRPGLPRPNRHRQPMLDMAIRHMGERLGGHIQHRWQAEMKGGAGMTYIGMVIQQGPAPTAA
jgi:hypothetical protein